MYIYVLNYVSENEEVFSAYHDLEFVKNKIDDLLKDGITFSVIVFCSSDLGEV